MMLISLLLAAIVTIFCGITGYTLELICDQDSNLKIFAMVVFFPITMIVGIGYAFYDFFAPILSDKIESCMDVFNSYIDYIA